MNLDDIKLNAMYKKKFVPDTQKMCSPITASKYKETSTLKSIKGHVMNAELIMFIDAQWMI
mgnify:CR=1 FL=1